MGPGSKWASSPAPLRTAPHRARPRPDSPQAPLDGGAWQCGRRLRRPSVGASRGTGREEPEAAVGAWPQHVALLAGRGGQPTGGGGLGAGGRAQGSSVARRGAGPAAARGAGRRRRPLRVFVLSSPGCHAAPPRARPAAVRRLSPPAAPLRKEAARRRRRRGSPPARPPMPPPRPADLHGRAWGEPRLPAPPGLSRRSPPSACWPPWGCSCAQVPRRRARPAGGERRARAAVRSRARAGAAPGPPRRSSPKQLRAPGSGAVLGAAARAGVRGAGLAALCRPEMLAERRAARRLLSARMHAVAGRGCV